MVPGSRRSFLALAASLPGLRTELLRDQVSACACRRRIFGRSLPKGVSLLLGSDRHKHRAGARSGALRWEPGAWTEPGSGEHTLTGFYLTALCIGAERRWKLVDECRERVRQGLRHLLNEQENVRGWYYHFTNRKSGERVWSSELSTVDTAFLLAGVVTAQQYFRGDAEIGQLASALYTRVDFPWMLNEATGEAAYGLDTGSWFLTC